MTDWKKSGRLILITLVAAYFFLCACGCALQRKLLYFPTKIPADAVVQAGAEHGFVPWKNNFGQIIGWIIPARSVATGSVLIVHGNAGCAIGRDYLAQPIHDAEEVNVFVLEYPGYGAREGSPSKKSFVTAAEEAFGLLPANLPRYVVSESLGTGVACQLAKNHPQQVAGMALFVPYHNLASVAQRRIWFLPTYFLLLDRFNPEECLKSYCGPVKFIVAGSDEVVGPASGIHLYDSYGGPKELQVIAGAHHNDVESQPSGWWRQVFLFWRENETTKEKTPQVEPGIAF
jgi:pimeloyl-ACP methyl ester carboxylesterase